MFCDCGRFRRQRRRGWVAGKIAGLRRAETGMLHGAIVWLVAVPALVIFATFGAGALFGGWFGGLAGMPGWVTPAAAAADPNAAAIARNEALAALTAIMVGLMGAVLGGWLASGEPMSVTHYRRRDKEERERLDAGRTTVRTTTVTS